jgi:hypothetical protein
MSSQHSCDDISLFDFFPTALPSNYRRDLLWTER